MLRTTYLKNFKNVTFDTLSFFFFCLMQLDERVLSNWRGLVKNALSLCIRSVPFSTSISRSCYHCRRRTCNLMVISSPRKSSNPFWSMMRIIRSIMLCASPGKWSVSASPISYILEACSVKIHVSCARFCCCCTQHGKPTITLHSTRLHSLCWSTHPIRVTFAAAVYASTRIPAATQCCWACQSPAPSRDCDVAALRADVARLCCFYRFRHAGRSADQGSERA